ncbi:unnamed protein product [Parajaminaea phylloscopi]
MLDIEGFRKAGYAAVDQICDYYHALQKDTLPVAAQVEPGFLFDQIPGQAPEEGEPWETINDDFKNVIMKGITHWQAPTFMAYYPCNATFEGGLADLHAAMISNPGFNWGCSPSVTELEIVTLNWVAKLLGLSSDFYSTSFHSKGGGIILGSASEVALTVAVAARERALSLLAVDSPEPEGQSDDGDQRAQAAAQWRARHTSQLVMYGTTQTHSVAAKAALILGLDFRALEVTKADGFALRGHTLKAALEEDEKRGRTPFMLIASLGTTSSGAVDHFQEIVEVAKSHPRLWIHVDAAYAGVALSLPEVREHCYPAGLDQVDSFSTNLHKWGLVQFDCSPLLIKDRSALSSALTITPEFLKTRHGDAGSVLDMRNLQIPLGRRFRSLKIWFVLRSWGAQGFRAHLRKSIEEAKLFEELLHSDERFELVAPPHFALRVFRLRGPDTAQADTLNRRLWDVLQTRNAELLLTQTVLPEVGFCIRLVTGAPLTTQAHIHQAWKVIQECADRAIATGGDVLDHKD